MGKLRLGYLPALLVLVHVLLMAWMSFQVGGQDKAMVSVLPKAPRLWRPVLVALRYLSLVRFDEQT